MALAKAVQGARHTAQVITWTDADGDPQVLTGATLTGRKLNVSSGVATNVSGTLTVTNATGGVFTWAYGTTDVATPGDFQVQFIATYADTTADKTLRTAWTVEPAI